MRTEVKIGLLVCIIVAGLVAGYLMIFPAPDEIAPDTDVATPAAPPDESPGAEAPSTTPPAAAQGIAIGGGARAAADPPAPRDATGTVDGVATPPGAAANTPVRLHPGPAPVATPPAVTRTTTMPPTAIPTGGIRFGAPTTSNPPAVNTFMGTPSRPISINAAPTARTRSYIVRAEDNGLWTISRKMYGAGRHHYLIRKANPGVNTYRLRPGMRLTIPPLPATTPRVIQVASVTPITARRPDGSVVHVIAKGDTCWSLAAKYLGASHRFQQIVRANPGINAGSLRIGQRIIIPKRAAAATTVTVGRTAQRAVVAGPGQKVHTIAKGDLLITIARERYGTASLWPAITKANPGLNPDALTIGRKIVLPTKAEAQRLAGLTPRSASAAMGSVPRASTAQPSGYVAGKPYFGN